MLIQHVTTTTTTHIYFCSPWRNREISIHAALRALSQIVSEVTSSGVSVCLAASSGNSSIQATEYGDVWLSEIRDASRAVPRTDESLLASQILLVLGEIDGMKSLETNLRGQWTGGEGEGDQGYKPSTMLGNMGGYGTLKIAGIDYGATPTKFDGLGGGDDEEMWEDLNTLSEAEEGLLMKWRDIMVRENRRERDLLEYRPEEAKGDMPREFFSRGRIGGETGGTNGKAEEEERLRMEMARAVPPAVRYHPREDEKINASPPRSRSTSPKRKKVVKTNALERLQVAHVGGAGLDGQSDDDYDDENDPTMMNLRNLQKFRQDNRSTLMEFDPESKYAHLKTVNHMGDLNDDGTGGESGPVAAGENGDGENGDEKKVNDFMNEFESQDKKSKRREGKAKNTEREHTAGKFPFRLNRYTIDQKTARPVRLWKGGDSLTDNPPLVDGKEEAKEVSTVALVVPTNLLGGVRGARGRGGEDNVNRLLKRAPSVHTLKKTEGISADSPNLMMACGTSGLSSGAGQQRDLVHEPDPAHCGEMDIRRYKNNWGGYLGFDL